MQLIILLNGHSLAIETGEESTLSELLEQLQQELNEVAFLSQDIDASPQLILNFNDVTLTDLSKTLKELGIRDKDIIQAQCVNAEDLESGASAAGVPVEARFYPPVENEDAEDSSVPCTSAKTPPRTLKHSSSIKSQKSASASFKHGKCVSLALYKARKASHDGLTETSPLATVVVAKQSVDLAKTAATDPSSRMYRCGVASYRPDWLQKLANPVCMLFWMCWFGLVQGIVCSGLVPSVMTSIERRYDLGDSELGGILQSYGFGYVLSVIPVSYFGRHAKPLFLFLGMLALSVGSVTFSLPHFYYDRRQLYVGNESPGVCQSTSLATHNNGVLMDDLYNPRFGLNGSHYKNLNSNKWTAEPQVSHIGAPGAEKYTSVFYMAQFIHGIGSTTLLTLGVSYIDENVKPTSSPFYIGIFYTFVIFGPAIGFTLTALLTKVHVDFLSAPYEKTLNMDARDPHWIGAWWVSFQILACLSFIGAFPVLMLPRVMPGAKKYQDFRAHANSAELVDAIDIAESSTSASAKNTVRVSDVIVQDAPKGSGIILLLQQLVAYICHVMTNGAYICVSISAAVEGIIIGGLTGFMAKYLEKQFNMPTSQTNLTIGFIMVPFAGMGVMSSGYIVKRFNLNCTNTIKYCLLMSVFTALLSPMFLVYCKPPSLVGVEVPYSVRHETPKLMTSPLTLNNTCNSHCKCNDNFSPLCAVHSNGSRSIYFSSCYAGCSEPFSYTRKVYTECKCIPEVTKVTAGLCLVDCYALTLFLVLFAPMVYCTMSIGVPVLSFVLRCVEYEERPIALGIQWIIIRCLGMIPAPMIYAWLFKVSCLRSRGGAAGQGQCFIYDNKTLAELFVALALMCKLVSCIFLVLALIFFRRSGKPDVNYQDDQAATAQRQALEKAAGQKVSLGSRRSDAEA